MRTCFENEKKNKREVHAFYAEVVHLILTAAKLMNKKGTASAAASGCGDNLVESRRKQDVLRCRVVRA